MSAEGVLLRFSLPTRPSGQSTDVYWLEQTQGDVPAGTDWLGPIEIECLQSLHFAKRRTDWLLGRWTAKQALATLFGVPSDLSDLGNIEILAAESGAPEVFYFGDKVHTTISLSHRAGIAMCSLSSSANNIGCDLETIEGRSAAFIADYFTAKEQTLIEQTSEKNRPLLVALLWSAKESALKALQTGLRLDTNWLEVSSVDSVAEKDTQWPGVPQRISRSLARDIQLDRWRPLEVIARDDRRFRGWWRYTDEMVRTILCMAQ